MWKRDSSATHHPGPQAKTMAQETQRDTAMRLSLGVGVLVSPPARLSVAVLTPNQRPDSSHRKDTGRSEGQQVVAAGPPGGCSLSSLGLHLRSGDRSALELDRTPPNGPLVPDSAKEAGACSALPPRSSWSRRAPSTPAVLVHLWGGQAVC